MNNISISHLYVSKHPIFRMGLLLLLLKLTYIYMVIKLLPEDYMLWSFRKDIHVSNIVFELLPFSIALFIYLRMYRHNAISVFCTMLFMVAFIPANSGLTLSNDPLDFYLQINVYLILLLYLLGRYSVREGNLDYQGQQNNILFKNKQKKKFRYIIIIALLVEIYQIYQYNGLNILSIFSSVMYDVRADYAESFAEKTGSLFTYLTIILRAFTNWLLLIFLYYSIIKKNVVDVFFCIFVVLAIFSMQMMKSTLFVLVVVLYAAWATLKNKLNNISEVLITSIFIFFVLAFVEYSLCETDVIFNVVIRRLFYVTDYMEYCHYEFFSTHHKLWFTQDFFGVQNVFSHIFGRFYTRESVGVISDNCFEGLLPAPNSGLFAEGYAQLGYLGTIIFPFIHAKLIYWVYTVSSNYGHGAAFIIMVKLCLSMLSIYIFASAYFVPLLIFASVTYILKTKKIKNESSSINVNI